MNLRAKLLAVLTVLSTQSAHATLPAGALVLARKTGMSLAARSAAIKIVPTVGIAVFLGACHYSSLKEGYEDAKNLVVKTKQNATHCYENFRKKFSDQAGNHVEFFDKKIEQNSGANKAWVGGKAGDINHITNNYYGKRSFADHFFEWLEKGKQTRAVGAGLALGTGFGYGLHVAVTSKQGPEQKVIVVQVPTADKN
jgi:hypothetical protein